MRVLRIILLLVLATTADAGELITLHTRDDVTQSFILLRPERPVAAVVLFAGGKGVLKLREDGQVGKGGNNFLVRSRENFRKAGFLVAVVDAPSDRQRGDGMRGGFRYTDEHAEDIAAVVQYIRTLGKLPVWLVGTSRGTESAANLAIRNPSLVDGIVLTASITVENNSGVSLPEMALDEVIVPVLIVSHEDDQCWVTPPDGAEYIKNGLVHAREVVIKTFNGGLPAVTDDCRGRSAHGFFGIESMVTDYISGFIRKRI